MLRTEALKGLPPGADGSHRSGETPSEGWLEADERWPLAEIKFRCLELELADGAPSTRNLAHEILTMGR